jgi:HAD superfamily hydrolase (TIGR01509 family)
MLRYDAAVFDLDGLLLDTERLAMAAGLETIAALGFTAVDGLFESLVGKDSATSLRTLGDSFGDDFPRDRFKSQWDQGFADKLDQGIPLLPGALEILETLEALGLPRALATSSQRDRAHHKLAQSGLARHFTAVVSVDCVTRPKPAPDPYLLAAKRLGVDATRCIAFEDSDTGAASARAAGMVVVQVPDMQKTDGRHAHHLARDLMSGARLAGLI